ncbi:hypothetical protein AB7M49_000212 [Bradyrhizobium elkanii]
MGGYDIYAWIVPVILPTRAVGASKRLQNGG